MLIEQLKQRALSMIQLPNHFRPVIEDYIEGENREGGAMFSWSTEERDEGITVYLDFAGNLTSLTTYLKEEISDVLPLNIEEKRELVEQFILSHYPEALKDLTFYKTKKLTRADRFYYEQIVMDLPLEHAGCFIDIDSSGNIVEFTYNGVKPLPEIPVMLISKETLREHMQHQLVLQLTITNLYMGIHDVAENGLRLVYEIDSFSNYRADVLKPTLTIECDAYTPETYGTPPFPITKYVHEDLSIEEILGIPESMEIIREVDMEEETGIVWRDREWEEKESDLSMNGFFRRQSEDTVKAFVSKKTGKIRSFMWLMERSGKLQLTREECYQNAVDFLQIIVPDYFQYLKPIIQENEDVEEELPLKEHFSFVMQTGQGIRIQDIVRVAVNCKTGQIDYYSGPSIGIEQLREIPDAPAISKEEASEIFCNHLDFELAWNKDYDSESESYNLVYQACSQQTRTPIRYIDAMTGALICDKHK
ncbi:MAG: DUF4901 domain-containing protein [Lysinibacillus sp.]